MSLICPHCGADNLKVDIGVAVFEFKFGLPHQEIAADRSRCEKCGWIRLTGFATEPYNVAGQEGWQLKWMQSITTMVSRAPNMIQEVDENWERTIDEFGKPVWFKNPK